MDKEFTDRPILTKEESDNIWCAIASLTVYADRKNNNMVGKELSEVHQNMLVDKCGKTDFKKWVNEDEVNKEAIHSVFEVLKERRLKQEMLDKK